MYTRNNAIYEGAQMADIKAAIKTKGIKTEIRWRPSLCDVS